MRKRGLHLGVMAVALAVAVMVVFGAMVVVADTGTGTITITGDTLSVDAQNVAFEAVALDGVERPDVLGYSSVAWVANDPTGDGSGWHVDISASDFTTGSYTIPLSGFYCRLANDSISDLGAGGSGTDVVSDMTSWTQLSGTPDRLIYAAATKGMGEYHFNPVFSIDVPAETYDAGQYSATITATITSGPGS